VPEIALMDRSATEDASDGGKRQQILDGARRVFLDRGFDGASMNEIARVAGVSKGTLYVYFDSKEALFEELIRQEKREQAEQLCRFEDHMDDDLRQALVDLGTALLSHILHPSRIAQLRTVIAVGSKFSRIGRAYYETGPRTGVMRLSAFLESRAEADRLVIKDYERAAEHLLDLCKSRYLLRAILGVDDPPPPDVLRAHVAEGVDVFLRAYQAR
jgi:AcrR family transcriptional regulator